MFTQLEPLAQSEFEQLKLLRSLLRNMERVCIAYSGGVDSALVAALAHEQLGDSAMAITGLSPALAPMLLKEARQQAAWIGIHHEECVTKELYDPSYRSNPANRCFACKRELHNQIKNIISQKSQGIQVLDGVNSDDLKEYRPGIKAANLAGVRSPLAELKINKATVRNLSRALGFPWFDKPSQPCLASRFPYGEEINTERLQRVANAEEWLINNGFPRVRVRTQGLSARIEVPSECINSLIQTIDRSELLNHFRGLGFTSIAIDLEGLISGKLNREIK